MHESTFRFRIQSRVSRLFSVTSARLLPRSRKLVAALDVRMEGLLVVWIGAISVLGLCKVAAAPIPAAGFAAFMAMMLPYLLIAAAPVAGYRVAAGSFPKGLLSGQPAIRLCRYGRWKPLDPVTVRANPVWGPAGFMASLIVGLLLNVPVRTLEFIAAIPAVSFAAPAWAGSLMWVMAADVIVMSFFYMVCFVMALRSIPLFPRMLVFVWVADIAMQFAIADRFAQAHAAPPEVAMALQSLLEGNIQKVLISAFIWLPYLIVSDRVNATFRNRIRA